jgi:putative ABC transport system permease protein
MKRLDRKLLRDLWAMKAQAFAIALVMASGVATLVMMLSAITSLREAQQSYYERNRFAHVFTHLKRAPDALAARVAALPGVAQVQTRVLMDVTLDLPAMDVPAVGRLISLDADPRAGLNVLHLRGGRFPERFARLEALVNEAFAVAHGFVPGDRVRAIINGRMQSLTIVGVAISPEYIYQIRPGEFIPDDKRFGVFWLDRRELAAATGLDGAFNDVALTLARGAREREVIEQLDTLTARYGGQGAYGRADQVSNRLVTDELTQLRAMATIPPAIFLAVSAFLLNVVISRLVQTQREQIAVLKAFGYTTAQVGAHFLKLVLMLTAAGLVLGVAAGAWLGQDLAGLYARYFRFPTLEFRLDPAVVVAACSVSAGAAVLGALGAVRRAMKLPPAEGMRPAEPAHYRPLLVERLGWERFVGRIPRMILRQLERKPLAASFSIIGISLAIAIVVLGSFSKDIIDFAVDLQFFGVQRYDVSVVLIEPTATRTLHEIRHLPGVMAAEPFRSVPVRIRFGHLSRQLGLLGLREGTELMRLIDTTWHETAVPAAGMVVSRKLAEILGARLGDVVTVEVMEGQRPEFEAPLSRLLDDVAGTSAYIDAAVLNRAMGEGDVMSGAFLRLDAAAVRPFFAALKSAPRIGVVSTKATTLASFRALMDENLLRMRIINVVFASIIAFGVVYNAARISLAERSRELATLRVIGFARGEISLIFLGEIAVLTLLAIPLGLVIGYAFAAFAVTALGTESQRFPLIVTASTYAFAVTTVLTAALLSSLVVRRQLDRLDLLAVLKAAT